MNLFHLLILLALCLLVLAVSSYIHHARNMARSQRFAAHRRALGRAVSTEDYRNFTADLDVEIAKAAYAAVARKEMETLDLLINPPAFDDLAESERQVWIHAARVHLNRA